MLYWFIASVVVLLVALPFAVIWSLNTIFALGLAFTFKNWAAILILCVAINGNTSK